MQLANIVRERWKGVLFCLIIAIPATLLGKQVEVVGGPVFAILFGMVLALVFPKNRREPLAAGVTYTSKKVLQYAVILLGFGMNLSQILSKGAQSLPIIVATISTSLVIAFVLCHVMNVPGKIATLVGVGSSICGGSAIAATAPVIDADDREIAQAISVILSAEVANPHGNGCSHAIIHHKADLGNGEHHLVGRQSSSPDPSHHNGTETERSSFHSHLHGNGPSHFVQVQEVCPVERIV